MESLDAEKHEQNAEKLKQGDPEALEALYKELAPRIRLFVASYCRGVNAYRGLDADDVVEEVFVTLFSNPGRVADLVSKGNLKAWCLRLSRNIILHQTRRAERRSTSESAAMEMEVPSEQPAADAETSTMQERTAKALALLAGSGREVIILHYLQHMTYSEIAEILGVKELEVRAMSTRAMSQLRMLLKGPAEKQTK